ncbi:MAG: hypothetical protein GWN99_07025, partial [Gemmatimonadetes bacterium]|nr:hypothetical protein [Gemmatimonadota bacterium]NIW74868.1 hypothetical protein [Gemmatimonadota bacterium]NIY43243.1 hypothetical protein [Gemmatimonadota bacterium]
MATAVVAETSEGIEAETDVPEVLEEAELRDPIQERVPVSASEYGTTRRMFLNRSLGGLFGFFSLALGAGV